MSREKTETGMNGNYGFVYGGALGVGMGVFTVTNGALEGVDFLGSKYRGHFTEDPETGELDVSFEMTVPAGVFLVQGTSPQDLEYTKLGAQKVPAKFGDGEPFKANFAPGIVTLMVKRIPDDFSVYVNGNNIRVELSER